MPPSDTSFICAGCREQIRICHPERGSVVLECPVDNCRREVWALPRPEAGSMIGAHAAPDLSRRFSVDQFRLLHAGRELIAGPADLLSRWAEELNAMDPPEQELPGIIRGMIQRDGRGCSFSPLRELIRLGLAANRRAAE